MLGGIHGHPGPRAAVGPGWTPLAEDGSGQQGPPFCSVTKSTKPACADEVDPTVRMRGNEVSQSQPRFPLQRGARENLTSPTLAAVAQWIAHQPGNQKATGLTPG